MKQKKKNQGKQRRIWKKISSHRIYHCPYINFYKDRVIDRLGQKTNFYYFKKGPFVAIVPEDEKGNIYLVRQYRYSIRKQTWELPMGSVHKGESYLQAAKRELAEEACLAAKKWTKIGIEHVTATVYPQRFTTFLAQGLKEIDKIPDPAEIDEVQKFSLREIEKMIKKNQIVGASVLASFHQYYLHKK